MCGRLADIRWSTCISKSQKKFVFLILEDGIWFMHIPFARLVKFNIIIITFINAFFLSFSYRYNKVSLTFSSEFLSCRVLFFCPNIFH